MGRLFGTNGVRGIVGDLMTPDLAMRLGRAVGTWSQGAVLVGRDTRTSGPMLQQAFVAGVLSTGTRAVLGGIGPTPSFQYAVKTGDYGSAAIVTASHNPPEFNGIKVVEPDGTELGDQTVEAIETLYFDERFDQAAWDDIPAIGQDPSVNDRYIDAILGHVGEGSVADKRPTVVLDCANGAGYDVAPQVLRRMGCHVITLNAQPDGTFPGHPSEPTPKNVETTLETVAAVGADLGVILDGDADRCVFVTGDGTFVPGERTLALVAGAKVEGNGGGLVVTPVASSQCIEDLVEQKGGQVKYTAVGSPIVAREMMASDALFGGEENGGLIFPEHQHCRDGTMTAAWLTKLVATTGTSLAELLDQVPDYTLVKQKVACPEEHKQAALDRFAETVDADRVDTTDGVKAFYGDGWVLVRPSGTEPLVRVYAEARDPERAREIGDDAKARVGKIVDSLT